MKAAIVIGIVDHFFGKLLGTVRHTDFSSTFYPVDHFRGGLEASRGNDQMLVGNFSNATLVFMTEKKSGLRLVTAVTEKPRCACAFWIGSA
jgi:hypothetical protein